MRAAFVLLSSSLFLAPIAAHGQARSGAGERVPHAQYLVPPTPSASLRENRDRVYCYRMGVKHDTGQGEKLDPAQAARWYRKAADLGHPEAMTALGMLYHEGRGVERDEARAAEWYRRGADAGSLPGSFNLAVMLSGGSSLPRDPAQARSLYAWAAERGHAKAQYNLALALAEPEDGQPDVEQAYKWLSLARDAGLGQAEDNLAILAQRMSAEQLRHASELARQWRPAAN